VARQILTEPLLRTKGPGQNFTGECDGQIFEYGIPACSSLPRSLLGDVDVDVDVECGVDLVN